MASGNRRTDLQNLKSLIQKSEKQLSAILESLKWSKDDVLKKKGYVTCPYDPGHTMPAASLNAHLDLCAWLKEGYSRQEKEAAPPSSHFFYTNSTSVVPVLIAEFCQKVKSGVPLTMERCFSELTPPERFAIYDHVVERGKATNKTSSVKLEDLQVNFEKKPAADEQRPPSQLELKSQMRDYKRRRQSYRAKNVHITRKTYTEILREVIENQTEYLKQLRAEDEDTADSATRPLEKDDGRREPQPRVSDSSRSRRESSVMSSSSKRRRSRSPGASRVGHESRHSTNSDHVHRSPEQQEHKKHHRSHHHKSKHKHKHKTKDLEDSR